MRNYLLALGLLVLASNCARRPAWPGFGHLAYLPPRPVHTLDTEHIKRLDSATARHWAPYPGLFRP